MVNYTLPSGRTRRENVAEVVVRRRSIAERQKPAQKRDLLLAEPCNIDEGFRPGEHCEQAQQQHLFERVDHLAALPRVRKIPKTPPQKKKIASPYAADPATASIAPSANRIRRITTDSALQPFVTRYFTRLPCGCRAWRLIAEGHASM